MVRSYSKMLYIGIHLVYILVILIFSFYLKVVYKCKRGVKLSFEVLIKGGNSSFKKNVKNCAVLPQPPGPVPWPILGNLALLGQFETPFEGFSALSEKYGKIFR